MSHEAPPTRPASLRARNADRDKTLSVLGTAYAEGQLTADEHESRVARALTAETVGDLISLIDDLLTKPEKNALHNSVHRRPPVHRRARVAAITGTVAVIAAGALLAGSLGGQEMEAVPALTAPVVPDEPVADEVLDEPVAPEPQPRYEPLTVAALQEFVDAYRDEFDTTRIYDASFRDDGHVSFEAVHGPARKNRLRGWRWGPVDGFSSSDEPSANVFSYAPVNLARLDLEAVVENLAHARKYLNVEDPDSTRFVLSRRDLDDSPARVLIYVGNQFNESAMMSTTLSGELISSNPFSPDGR